MKSTDKFVLVLVASLALLLAGCGGGSSSNNGDDMDMDMDMSMEQKTALMNAHSTLQQAVNALVGEATQEEVNAAMTAATALQNAINAATDVADSDLAMYRSALTNANTAIGTAQDLLTTQGNKEMTAMAKALKAAIGIDKLNASDAAVAALGFDPKVIPVLDGDGDTSTTTDDTTIIELEKGDSPGMLGSWKGTDYSGMVGTGAAKTTGMTRTYSNAEASKSVGFTSEAGVALHSLALHTATPTKLGDYTVPADGSTANENIAGSKFPTTGQQTYTGDNRKFSGTYMGASGTYECTSTGDCTARVDGDGAITLAGTWTFTPSANAMVQQKDVAYLHFGWWIRKDSKGNPTHAGAIYGMTGATLQDESLINTANLVGEAKYVGKAAGKFAISDPLRPANDNAGHFTANAELMADFKSTGSTLSGTIDMFRLNDGSTDPGWSVDLQKATFVNDDDKFRTADTPDGDQTVWSISGNKGAASGSWEAQMYNDKAGDGNNTPDSIVGSFMSNIGNTHELVGAFGAEKE